jgi:hypothetical protein
MASKAQTKPKEWVALLVGKRAQRLGTVKAADAEAAIAAAIDEFKIAPERQGRVIVRPIAQSN